MKNSFTTGRGPIPRPALSGRPCTYPWPEMLADPQLYIEVDAADAPKVQSSGAQWARAHAPNHRCTKRTLDDGVARIWMTRR